MKTLSVLLTLVLFLGASHLASKLRPAGVLPAKQSAAPAATLQAAAAHISISDTLLNPQFP